MNGRRRHKRRYTTIDDDSFERDVQIFVFSLLIGLVIGGFIVYLMIGGPRVTLPVPQTPAQCEADKTALIKQGQEALNRLAQCNTQLSRREPSPPPAAPVVTPVQPPAAEPEATSKRGSIPIPRRPPSRPKGEAPSAEAVGAARIASAVSAVLKVGEQQEFSPGYKIRLAALSKRRTGTFCVIAGTGFAKDGARIASGTSVKSNWNGQKLTVSASAQGQGCKISVRP